MREWRGYRCWEYFCRAICLTEYIHHVDTLEIVINCGFELLRLELLSGHCSELLKGPSKLFWVFRLLPGVFISAITLISFCFWFFSYSSSINYIEYVDSNIIIKIIGERRGTDRQILKSSPGVSPSEPTLKFYKTPSDTDKKNRKNTGRR